MWQYTKLLPDVPLFALHHYTTKCAINKTRKQIQVSWHNVLSGIYRSPAAEYPIGVNVRNEANEKISSTSCRGRLIAAHRRFIGEAGTAQEIAIGLRQLAPYGWEMRV